ncbi:MAG: hypothetical protein GY865_12650, partial [candidate division Zixibacteria bacterium]|nr:hypothetical protein [candidate division Zixibacteria bacterium]
MVNRSQISSLIRIGIIVVLFVFSGLILQSCSSPPALNPEEPYWLDNDKKPIPEPNYKEPNLMWMTIKRTSFDQLNEILDIDRDIRKIAGNMTKAKNVNSLD